MAFLFVWALPLALIPFTVLKVTPLPVAMQYPATITHFIQRILGLTAFTLVFWQIILGSYMVKLTEKLGGWVFKFHITEGIFLYGIIVLHPVSFVFFNYFAGKGIDPFYVFTQVCVLCPNLLEFYYSLGRISFWLLTIAVFVAFFRTATPYFRYYWRRFHVLNYLVFLLIGIHSFGVGTDMGTFPFSLFYGPAIFIVSCIILFKGLPRLYRFVKSRG